MGSIEMKYRKEWELSTIPFEAIPRELLKRWWSLHSNAIKGKKHVDPKRRAFLDKKAEYMRQRRAKEKPSGL
jgi:hypothetical protein